jgi:hypothetical protein
MHLSDIELALGFLVGMFCFLGIGAVIDEVASWWRDSAERRERRVR